MIPRVFPVLAALCCLASAQYQPIAGYVPSSNVTQHARIDLDMAQFEALVDAFDWSAAKAIYENGANSAKTTSLRTIAGFSTAAETKLKGEPLFDLYYNYWYSYTYAHDVIMDALDGTGSMTGQEDIARAEVALKVAQYWSVWQYVSHELLDAIQDCKDGTLTNNDAGVVAWDEGWAFYAGSLEVDGSGTGQLLYTLAQKRCENFGTCSGADGISGTANVNVQILSLFIQGRELLKAGQCTPVESIYQEIIAVMTIPLVQGALRYVYKADPLGGNGGAKEIAEGWAFTAALLPQLAACSASEAAIIRANMELSATSPVALGYASIFAKFQACYPSMAITCAQVGGLLSGAGASAYFPGAGVCTDPIQTPTYRPLAGYQPLSNVAEHAQIDLDVAVFENRIANAQWTEAQDIYQKGMFSQKTNILRTLAGFSTAAQSKMVGEELYNLYQAYWGSYTYADDFIMGALMGSGNFAGTEDVARYQAAIKGVAYQSVWMYVSHELVDAINDCEAGNLQANDGGVNAWDEGVAFYTGSLETYLLYALAEKRCVNFGTCTGADGVTGLSHVNVRIRERFEEGREFLANKVCGPVAAIYKDIVVLMTIPQVQGTLRYAYKADPNGEAGGAKEIAEGWAFAAAILPQLHRCSPSVAELVRRNMWMDAPAVMVDGYKAVFEAIQSCYPSMGITCADIGSMPNVDGSGCTGDRVPIAGYVPGTDVTEHSEIDLDMAMFEHFVDSAKWTEARTLYLNGKFSEKSTGLRNLAGFSTAAESKMIGEPLFDMYYNYWQSYTYADDFIKSALAGTGTFAGKDNVARAEGALKGAQYWSVWMYHHHEFRDAINDCVLGTPFANDASVHAWDEGVAFFAGSLEGAAGGSSGQLIYALAEKRCQNFGTCSGADGVSGTASVNLQLRELFAQGRELLNAGVCGTSVEHIYQAIVSLTTVPLLQGALRYAYKSDPLGGSGGSKEIAEGWAFTAAVLPQIHDCNPGAAQMLRSNMAMDATSPVADGFATVFETFQSCYAHMGISCADVGGLLQEGSSAYVTGAGPCTDAASATANPPLLAGYQALSNVVEHAEIDLDVAVMGNYLVNYAWAKAKNIYENGMFSKKTSSIRNLAGFSTAAETKMKGEALYDMYATYWNSYTYAHDFVSAALDGTGIFDGQADVARKEGALKGAQYMNIWMYVTHEMVDAIQDCQDGNLLSNDAGVVAWDEGVAFYVGSLEGTLGNGEGQLLYTLAQKRCQNFGTCSGTNGIAGTAKVNVKIRELFEQGRTLLQDGVCNTVDSIVELIVSQMSIPLIQGALRYAYKMDPNAGAGGPKERAEGWAFTAAVLPQLHACSPDVAAFIRKNMELNATTPVVDGYAKVFEAFQSCYHPMGIQCTEVGGLLKTGSSTEYFPHTEVCAPGALSLAGYQPDTDVIEHSQIDLDVAVFEHLVDAYAWADAKAIYQNGLFSAKSTGTRTLAGFSTAAETKLKGEPLFDLYRSYWGSYTYADNHVLAALDGTGTMAGKANIARAEVALKTVQYQSVWMYVSHEMMDAIGDCVAGDLSRNDAGVHAWDEAYAFMVGSLEGRNGTNNGQLIYALAQKRCINFGTCQGGTTGIANVNVKLLELFLIGRELLKYGVCGPLPGIYDQIISQMTIPLLQGTLRYAYKADPDTGGGSPKEVAEGWAFAASVLPQLQNCSASVATAVRTNMDITAVPSVVDGYTAVYQAVQSCYADLGITCAEVGGLLMPDSTTDYYPGAGVCTDGNTQFPLMAGYQPTSNVVPHSQIDLDMAVYEILVDSSKWEEAKAIYQQGQFSTKSTGMRTIAGFSTAAESKMKGQPLYDMYYNYWGSYTYADDLVVAALDGTGPYTSDVIRAEVALKVAQYQSVWMYVSHEMMDAIADCKAKDLTNNDNNVKAWDEAYAFYSGSLEGSEGTGAGQLLYTLAEKRCANFGTCSGIAAKVNLRIRELFQQGRDLLLNGLCSSVESIYELIISQMTVPLIQGAQRYAYKSDPMAGSGGDKEKAEGWVFIAAVLPQIHGKCSPAAATALRDNLDIAAAVAVKDGYGHVFQTLQSCYKDLGISCEDVGTLTEADTLPPCVGGRSPLAGYVPVSDVTEHAEIDLDMATFEGFVDAYQWADAKAIYDNGKYSAKSTSLRTLAGFSKAAQSKMVGEPLYDLYYAYWQSYTYADDFVRTALDGSGAVPAIADVARAEMALKGAQYQGTWMYVVHEMVDAINDCKADSLLNNDASVVAWDEAVAFHTGSLEGTSGSSNGQLGWALAQKRCENFGTCDGTTGTANVNAKLQQLFAQGRELLLTGLCSRVEPIYEEIISLMTVPLVQGSLRYAYKADPSGGAGGDKEKAEGWAFTAAVLPQLHKCDPATASMIRENMEFPSAVPVKDGYAAVFAAIQSCYPSLGISCADVGGLLQPTGGSYAGAGVCVDPVLPPQDLSLAGYVFASDVREHMKLDLDMAVYERLVDAFQWDQARAIYQQGLFSSKTNSLRTIAGFSTGAGAKMVDEPLYRLYRDYWNSDTYADDLVQAALLGTGDFQGVADVVRAEVALKVAQYHNVFMYVSHELLDAIKDCKAGSLTDNDAGVKAWDEGFAFYTGSLVGTPDSNRAQMLWTLAEKRCKNFATCANGASGTSNVNTKIKALFEHGRDLLEAGVCAPVESVYGDIISLMSVPLIQGTLRYAYKVAKGGGDKEKAEGWAFAAAILPSVNAFSPSVAQMVRDNLAITSPTPMAVGYDAFVQQLQTQYTNLGISCMDVGVLVASGPVPGQCDMSVHLPLAGYVPLSGMTERAQIDLDMALLEHYVDAFVWDKALDVYLNGKFSEKSLGAMRTLAGFSTAAGEKMTGQPLFERYKTYWGTPEYAHLTIMDALQGNPPFDTMANVVRAEVALKVAQYQSVFLYVSHEMQDGIADCKAGEPFRNDAGVFAWDEAVAFYTGSLEGRNGTTAGTGQLLWTLAQKRCANFGTCADGVTGIANVNLKLRTLFEQGRELLRVGACDPVDAIYNAIISQMTIPILQGTLRYLYKSDPSGGAGGDKERAEAWAFASTILPQIQGCSVQAAESLKGVTSLSNPSITSFRMSFQELQQCYPYLGITCAEVGNLLVSGSTSQTVDSLSACEQAVAASTIAPPSQGESSSLPGWPSIKEHSELDLDVLVFGSLAKRWEWASAKAIYENGMFSAKTTSLRTLAGFSTSAQTKMETEPLFNVFKTYWNSPAYAHNFVLSALDATGDFVAQSQEVRAEAALQGTVYMNVWMYVIHEVMDAINDCKAGTPLANDAGVFAWDEAVAFYTGSLGSTSNGQMLNALADEQCKLFRTCNGPDGVSGSSKVNVAIFALFHEAREALSQGDCAPAEAAYPKIVAQMTVPLIQKILSSAYRIDQPAESAATLAESVAGGWASVAALLPCIHQCSPPVEKFMKTNMVGQSPTPDGYQAVFQAMTACYQGWGITCEDVGGLLSASRSQVSAAEYVSGAGPCTLLERDDDGDKGPVTIGGSSTTTLHFGPEVIVVIVLAALLIFLGTPMALYYARRLSNARLNEREQDNVPLQGVADVSEVDVGISRQTINSQGSAWASDKVTGSDGNSQHPNQLEEV